MTLLVGIKCDDGVIIGADSAATFGDALGGKTIIQTTSKVEIIGDRVVLAVSGPVGLGQAFHREIDEYISKKIDRRATWKTIADARVWLQDNMWEHAKPLWENATVIARGVGGAAFNTANSASLMAFAIDDEPHLVQFNHQCAPEEATAHLPFVTLGSGQANADPFLGFISSVLWPKHDVLPSFDLAMFATVWTLQQTIKHSPGGVGGPIEIVTLKKEDGKNWRAKKYVESDLQEHIVMIDEVQTEMRNALQKYFTKKPTTPIPKAT
jgi:predicted proteasome-type protease